ncbi:MAG: hypothetical protein ABI417_07990 [Coleofasciculaceae cyanobacterium]
MLNLAIYMSLDSNRSTIEAKRKELIPMAYSNFTLAKVKEAFDLTANETQNLFADIKAVKASKVLTII